MGVLILLSNDLHNSPSRLRWASWGCLPFREFVETVILRLPYCRSSYRSNLADANSSDRGLSGAESGAIGRPQAKQTPVCFDFDTPIPSTPSFLDIALYSPQENHVHLLSRRFGTEWACWIKTRPRPTCEQKPRSA